MSRGLWKAVCWVSAGSACWCAWGVGYVVGGCNVQCTWLYWARQMWSALACMQKLLSPCMSSAGFVWYVWYVWYMVCMVCWSLLCCEILLLLNMVDMDRWKQWRSQSSAITGALGGHGYVLSQGELWPQLWDSVTRTCLELISEVDGQRS